MYRHRQTRPRPLCGNTTAVVVSVSLAWTVKEEELHTTNNARDISTLRYAMS
jgi:hypothetical protein